MLKMNFSLKNETKTCYRFENKEGGQLTTLYLKKEQVDRASINPKSGIIVKIEEDNNNV